MADVIDEFVVALRLDPANYQREIGKYRDDQKKLRQEQDRANREQEDGQKRLTQGLRTLRNEAAGFVLMLAGASSIKSFATDLLAGDAATGRFANNIGLATERVGAWEQAMKRAGGTEAGGRGLLGKATSIYQEFLLGQEVNPALSGLGLTPQDASDPEKLLLKLSEASQKLPAPMFRQKMLAAGFDEASITLLSKGRVELEKLLRDMEAKGLADKKAADSAIAFDNSLADLEQTLKGKARPAVDALADGLRAMTDDQDKLNAVTDIGIGLIGAAGIAAGIAYWPFIALAAAIAGVASAFRDANHDAQDWAQSAKFWEQLKKGDWSGAAQTFGESASDTTSRWMRGLGYSGSQRAGGIAWGERSIADYNRGRDVMGNPIGGAAGSTGAGGRNVATVQNYFKSKGYSDQQVQGITAAIVGEGGLGKRTGGGYRGRALGIGQLLGPRRDAFLKRYGPNFTLQDELDFMDWELRGGDKGGAAVRSQGTAGGTLNSMIRSFYRPRSGYETIRDLQSGNSWLRSKGIAGTPLAGGSGNTTNVGTIIVNTKATDADGIARDMRSAIAKRGLVNQANTGLTG